MNKKVMLVLCALLLAALVCGAFYFTYRTEETIENAGTAQNGVEKQVSLTYQGTEYALKPHIETVLLIGTDSEGPYQPKKNSLQDYYNFNQADVLMLLVLDKDQNRAEVIQLNRDTMSDVPWLDVLGNYGGTEFKQICLAYNYGDGGIKSCKNTVDAVSRLLFDAPIQHFIQIPISAISVVNDLVGGVPVTMTEDLTVIDPAFTQGAEVRLNGSQAEQFLRVRMALENDTNQARMERHRIYLDSFQSCIREALNEDSGFALKLVESLSEYMQSDMTVQQLSDLIEDLEEAENPSIRTPAGELKTGGKFYEFYVNNTSLWETVKTAYCQ